MFYLVVEFKSLHSEPKLNARKMSKVCTDLRVLTMIFLLNTRPFLILKKKIDKMVVELVEGPI